MFLISNGDTGTITTMIVVESESQLADAVKTFCRATNTAIEDVVVNELKPPTDRLIKLILNGVL